MLPCFSFAPKHLPASSHISSVRPKTPLMYTMEIRLPDTYGILKKTGLSHSRSGRIGKQAANLCSYKATETASRVVAPGSKILVIIFFHQDCHHAFLPSTKQCSCTRSHSICSGRLENDEGCPHRNHLLDVHHPSRNHVQHRATYERERSVRCDYLDHGTGCECYMGGLRVGWNDGVESAACWVAEWEECCCFFEICFVCSFPIAYVDFSNDNMRSGLSLPQAYDGAEYTYLKGTQGRLWNGFFFSDSDSCFKRTIRFSWNNSFKQLLTCPSPQQTVLTGP